jgi:hypothetical protein
VQDEIEKLEIVILPINLALRPLRCTMFARERPVNVRHRQTQQVQEKQ